MQEQEGYEEADRKADEWRAREIAKAIARSKVIASGLVAQVPTSSLQSLQIKDHASGIVDNLFMTMLNLVFYSVVVSVLDSGFLVADYWLDFI